MHVYIGPKCSFIWISLAAESLPHFWASFPPHRFSSLLSCTECKLAGGREHGEERKTGHNIAQPWIQLETGIEKERRIFYKSRLQEPGKTRLTGECNWSLKYIRGISEIHMHQEGATTSLIQVLQAECRKTHTSSPFPLNLLSWKRNRHRSQKEPLTLDMGDMGWGWGL